MFFTGSDGDLLLVRDVDRDQIRLIARREIVAVLRGDRRTWIHTVREEFATYYTILWLISCGGNPFVQIGIPAVANLQAIEHITRYGDRPYRVRLRDPVGTEITASARLSAVLRRTAEKGHARQWNHNYGRWNKKPPFSQILPFIETTSSRS
jgi:hypothetical protein